MFWGLIMEPQRRYTQTVKKAFHVSMASLDYSTSSDEPAQVMCGYEGRNYLLCTLRKPDIMQCPLDLNFEVGSELSFATNGKCHVHLTGYLIQDIPEFSEEQEEEEENLDEEDEAQSEQTMETEKKKNKRSKNKMMENGPPAKKSKRSLSIEDDEDEESDSDESELGTKDLLSKSFGDSEDDESFAINEEEQDEDDVSDSDDDLEDGLEEEDDNEESDEADSDEEEGNPVMNNKKKLVNGSPKIATPKNKQNKSKNEAVTPGSKSPAKEGKTTNKENKTPGKEGQMAKKKALQGGVIIEDIKEGQGIPAKAGKYVSVYYEGRLKQNNKLFDSTTKGNGFSFRLGGGEVIKGWDVGVVGMKVGGKRRITCPPAMAYGSKGSPPAIPPNSSLVFEVELKKVK